MKHILMIFLDGIGLGDDDPADQSVCRRRPADADRAHQRQTLAARYRAAGERPRHARADRSAHGHPRQTAERQRSGGDPDRAQRPADDRRALWSAPQPGDPRDSGGRQFLQAGGRARHERRPARSLSAALPRRHQQRQTAAVQLSAGRCSTPGCRCSPKTRSTAATRWRSIGRAKAGAATSATATRRSTRRTKPGARWSSFRGATTSPSSRTG